MSSFPTSYIKTLGTAVTRSADAMTRTLGQEWNPNEGTFVVEFDGAKNTPNNNGFIFTVQNNNFSTDYIIVYLDTGGTMIAVTKTGAASEQILTIANSSNSSGKYKIALSVNTDSLLLSVNGGDVSTISRAITPSFDLVIFGDNSAADRTIGQCEYSLSQYYPRAFDALTLQRLSRIQ